MLMKNSVDWSVWRISRIKVVGDMSQFFAGRPSEIRVGFATPACGSKQWAMESKLMPEDGSKTWKF